MFCPRCGQRASLSVGRCPSCGATFANATVATDFAPIDTTGLPTGATFNAFNRVGADRDATSGAPISVNVTIGAVSTIAGTIGGGAAPEGALTGGPLQVGQSFGVRYHIIKVLGVGGMGAVYQAWDAELGVAVALKVIRTDATRRSASVEAEKRFKQELLLARQVTHKNVVRIHDLGEIDGIKYITMPFVQGNDLSAVLRRDGKLPMARALRLARQIADGLEAAHEAGVVHRDLKPANVMIGADDLALIMDFGISASADEAAGGGIVGTFEYMAPEQSTGAAADLRADIYAFGLILYEMLTGPRAMSATTAQERFDAMRQRTSEGLPSVRALDETIPVPVDALVTRCLERDPASRFATTAELVAALAALDDAGELIPIPKQITRSKIAAAAVVALLLAGGSFFTARRLSTPARTPDPVAVLIADFDNQAADPVFTGAIEETLARSIEGASFVNIYPRATAAQLASKLRPGTGLSAETGKLVARSEGVHVLMTGSIGRDAGGYAITVRAIDPLADAAEKKPLAVLTAEASSREQVLQAVGTLGARLRGALGDTTPESARLAAAETFTTSSPEAVKTYTLAQDLLVAGRSDEAFAAYLRAIEQDPSFGRAYSGAAITAARVGREADAQEFWKKALSLLDRMTERERYRTLGAYYIAVPRNYAKAIENYSALVERYPADRSGHASLALAYFWSLDIPQALKEEKRALELDPKSTILRANYAFYAMYAGDFETGRQEMMRVFAQEPSIDASAYVPLAMAALARGDAGAARETYRKMAEHSTSGASLASIGLADVALYEGRYADVEPILAPAIAAAEHGGDQSGLGMKYIALGEAYEGLRQPGRAIAAARAALKLTAGKPQQVLAAAILVRAGQDREASAIAAQLSEQLQPQTRAYGKLLEGLIALKQRRMISAVEAFTAAQKLADFWTTRFNLGVAYIDAGEGHAAEALAELQRAEKRRGEAAAIFLDEVPSYRYLATLPYWLARAEEGLGMKDAAANHLNAFLALRSRPPFDALVMDARKRARP